MKYSLVFFDADDTLFDFSKSQEIAFRESISHFNISYHTDRLYYEYKKSNKELWAKLEQGSINADELRLLRFKNIFETHKINQDPKIFGDYYIEKISKSTHLIPYALQICQFIKSLNIKIGIITNGFTDTQKNRFEKSELFPFFDSITISQETGFRKPQPEIFEIALKKHLNIKKEEVLMIGDNLHADILGANEFGMDTCWFHKSGGQPKADIQPKYIITELMQLKKIIAKT
ncbi:YjjG family noncanonical pyrimidine nucleotidase [Silvanigrella paludirubra]|jgi:YjjG family noncanonical pyrimidine nucleotidase|nr:YjjG family noncanonical pyrimidine nucleotidase [Silvanigrella paludirubra]